MKQVMERLGELFSLTRILDSLLGKLLPDLIVAAITLAAFYLL